MLCGHCKQKYFGEAKEKKSFSTRKKEHISCIKNCHPNKSALEKTYWSWEQHELVANSNGCM